MAMASQLLFFALPSEARPFLRLAASAGIPFRSEAAPKDLPGVRRFVGTGIEVWISGVGPRNAAATADAALEAARPTRVVTAGIAGALRPDLRIGDVVHDALELPELAEAFRRRGSVPGRIETRPKVAVLASEKARIREESGADLVEMESGAIRERCRAAGIPSATVRSVSDLATGDLPLDFNRVYDSKMALSPWLLARAILARPAAIPGLMALGRHAGTASDSLAQVLGVLWERD